MIHLGRCACDNMDYEVQISNDNNVIILKVTDMRTGRSDERTYLRLSKDSPLNNLERNVLSIKGGML